jgi:hypothetical protein
MAVTRAAHSLRLQPLQVSRPMFFYPSPRWRALGAFSHLRTNHAHTKTLWVQGTNLRGSLEVTFGCRWRLAPNSSPSRVRLNPDEPNLWLWASSISKASPPWIGVETKHLAIVSGARLLLLLLSLFTKRLACDIASQPDHGDTHCGCKEYHHTRLPNSISCRYAWPSWSTPFKLRCSVVGCRCGTKLLLCSWIWTSHYDQWYMCSRFVTHGSEYFWFAAENKFCRWCW